jgi:hypothetical protein
MDMTNITNAKDYYSLFACGCLTANP